MYDGDQSFSKADAVGCLPSHTAEKLAAMQSVDSDRDTTLAFGHTVSTSADALPDEEEDLTENLRKDIDPFSVSGGGSRSRPSLRVPNILFDGRQLSDAICPSMHQAMEAIDNAEPLGDGDISEESTSFDADGLQHSIPRCLSGCSFYRPSLSRPGKTDSKTKAGQTSDLEAAIRRRLSCSLSRSETRWSRPQRHSITFGSTVASPWRLGGSQLPILTEGYQPNIAGRPVTFQSSPPRNLSKRSRAGSELYNAGTSIFDRRRPSAEVACSSSPPTPNTNLPPQRWLDPKVGRLTDPAFSLTVSEHSFNGRFNTNKSSSADCNSTAAPTPLASDASAPNPAYPHPTQLSAEAKLVNEPPAPTANPSSAICTALVGENNNFPRICDGFLCRVSMFLSAKVNAGNTTDGNNEDLNLPEEGASTSPLQSPADVNGDGSPHSAASCEAPPSAATADSDCNGLVHSEGPIPFVQSAIARTVSKVASGLTIKFERPGSESRFAASVERGCLNRWLLCIFCAALAEALAVLLSLTSTNLFSNVIRSVRGGVEVLRRHDNRGAAIHSAAVLCCAVALAVIHKKQIRPRQYQAVLFLRSVAKAALLAVWKPLSNIDDSAMKGAEVNATQPHTGNRSPKTVAASQPMGGRSKTPRSLHRSKDLSRAHQRNGAPGFVSKNEFGRVLSIGSVLISPMVQSLRAFAPCIRVLSRTVPAESTYVLAITSVALASILRAYAIPANLVVFEAAPMWTAQEVKFMASLLFWEAYVGLTSRVIFFCVAVDFVGPTRSRVSLLPHSVIMFSLVLLGCRMTVLFGFGFRSIFIFAKLLLLCSLVIASLFWRILDERAARKEYVHEQLNRRNMKQLRPSVDRMLVVQRLQHYLCELDAAATASGPVNPVIKECLNLVQDPTSLILSHANKTVPPQSASFHLSRGVDVATRITLIREPKWWAMQPPLASDSDEPLLHPERHADGSEGDRGAACSPSLTLEDGNIPSSKPILLKTAGLIFDLNFVAIDQESDGNILIQCGLGLMSRVLESGLPEDSSEGLDLSLAKQHKLFRAIQDRYLDQPYHNRVHGAQVAHHFAWFLQTLGVSKLMLTSEIVASYIAALGHDIGHPGVTNSWLVSTQHYLAILYNDQSVLENYHAANLFKLLEVPENNILSGSHGIEWQLLRRQIVDMVLATDMQEHFELLAVYQLRRKALNFFRGQTHEVDCDKRLALQICLKAADLAYVALPWDQALWWTERVYEEFWRQGDIEVELNLPISPLCDRRDQGTAAWYLKNGKFWSVFVMPLMNELVETWRDLRQDGEDTPAPKPARDSQSDEPLLSPPSNSEVQITSCSSMTSVGSGETVPDDGRTDGGCHLSACVDRVSHHIHKFHELGSEKTVTEASPQ